MNKTCFFFIFTLSCTVLLAQEHDNYFTKIAGDSAISIGKKLENSCIGDTTRIKLGKGLYRLVFNKGIGPGDDFHIQILNSQGQVVENSKHKRYVDIHNDSTGGFDFILTGEKTFDQEIVGEIFWVYSKNVRRPAPEFRLKDIDGQVYTRENLLGKIVIFNFWGIWCKPCRLEIPQLNNLVKKYSGRPDIVFLAVSNDQNEDLRDFSGDTPFDYQLISEQNATELNIEMTDTGMISFPSHAVLDKSGKVVFIFLGTNPEIEQLLSRVIEKYK